MLMKIYPEVNFILMLMGKLAFSFGPITIFLYVYHENNKIALYIKEKQPLPESITSHYGEDASKLDATNLTYTGIAALFIAFLWTLFIIFLAFSDRSIFLNIP